MARIHGTTADRRPITEEIVEQMADEAERKISVSEAIRRAIGQYVRTG